MFLAVPSPSTVVTSQPSAWTANMRHDPTARPSTMTVHAPQTPCSQPTWVPVRLRWCRRKSLSNSRTDTFARLAFELTFKLISRVFTTLPLSRRGRTLRINDSVGERPEARVQRGLEQGRADNPRCRECPNSVRRHLRTLRRSRPALR